MTLWDFAVEVYRRPGVEAACLALQDDHGQCVPLLLWRSWLGDRPLVDDELAAAIALVRRWNDAVVAPLRAVRRGLADPAPPLADAGRLSLRASVKAAELAAERLLLEALQAMPTGEAGGAAAPVEALAAVAQAWSGPAPSILLGHLVAAATSARPGPTGAHGNSHA